jgi:galactokinase
VTISPDLIARVAQGFVDHFGTHPAHVVHAPGRVNLIGEHTDYNDGFVLPCAINFGTVIAIGPKDGTAIESVAMDYNNAQDQFDISMPMANRGDADWTDHVRGVVSVLLTRGHALDGAIVAIGGNVPQGAGLSSSASLGVAMANALAAQNSLKELSLTDFALIAQQSENEFVGCACGIMDQLVSARAEAGHATLIDCRSLTTTAIPIPADLTVLIVHSGVRRELAESAYNERREQCEAVATHFGVKALRDLDLKTLEGNAAALDPVAFQRARHVITENNRTLAAADALTRNDLTMLGHLMAESHASMRDDFEITVPPVDALVALIQSEIGTAGGVRMTGGGFGGCVVAVLPKSAMAKTRAAIESGYRTPAGAAPMIIEAEPSAGARILPMN